MALCVAGAAQAASDNENTSLLSGPPVMDVVSPYDAAFNCLRSVLTPEQRRTSFSVGYFADRTGKTNYVSDSGTGSFSTQGAEDMVYTSLALTGVQVVDSSMPYRQMVDWTIGKMALNPGSGLNLSLMFPDVTISGAITSFDINMSSGGVDARVYGVGGGRRKHRILVGMEGRTVLMPGGRGEAGRSSAFTRINKQIVGYENEAGVTSFFGRAGSATLFEINLGERKNEAIQHIERVMIDRLVFDLVSGHFNERRCDSHRSYGDSLAQPQ